MKNTEYLSEYKKFYRKNKFKIQTIDSRLNPISNYLTLNLRNNNKLPLFDLKNSISLNDRNNITHLLRLNEAMYVFLSEGLIKTSSYESVIKQFNKWCKNNLSIKLCNLTFADVTEQHWATDELKDVYNNKIIDSYDKGKYGNIDGLLTFYIPFDSTLDIDQIVKKLSDDLYVCGYNIAQSEVIGFDESKKKLDVDIAYVTFEPKFLDVDYSLSNSLYHMTLIKYLPKIAKTGLVPTSKHRVFTYPDRVYLFNGDQNMWLIEDYGVGKIIDSKTTQCALLKIDTKKLQDSDEYKTGKLNLRVDMKYPVIDEKKPKALFSYNNIPLKFIDDNVIIFDVDGERFVNKFNDKLSNYRK